MNKGILGLLSGLLGCAAIASFSPMASADVVAMSGHICKGFAPHNQDRYLRFKDGGIQNVSYDKEIKVSCPIQTDMTAPTFNLIVRPTNAANFSQTIYCDLRELDKGDWVQRNVRKSKSFPPGISNSLEWMGLRRSNSANRFDLVCTMPPRTTIGLIAME
ncbi:hypothetical protein EY643_18900 [Halioglobus maricola]|uniref:Uncharacterized protein n=1 Tax=Halioglobus maricola TaxID=2601894 RepID=A0A5P9NQJ9_9GAMM|nr:hypothetical protein [Halioglobus maricola]QFU77574.1 hypothetical protein EY643_18900 [Halioglobus maricola]